MGILGQYMAVNEETMQHLFETDKNELVDKIEELEEADNNEIYGVDKLWDGLHFLLTGVSASEPIENNKLSEAVVGVHVFNSEDYVAGTAYEELKEIIKTMEQVDFERLKNTFEISEFKKADIYPNIWAKENAGSLFQELKTEFFNLLTFYKQISKDKLHVLVSIY